MPKPDDTELLTEDCKIQTSSNNYLKLTYIFFLTSLSYMAIWINVYCVSEWTQDHIKKSLFGNETVHNSSACSNDSTPDYAKLVRVQQETARWSMYNTMVVMATSLVIALLLTVYTDVFGRRFLFILSCISLLINHTLSAIVIYYNLDLFYTLFVSAIYGLTGTSYALISVAYSCIADLTESGTKRSTANLCNSIFMSIGATIGSYSVGVLIEAYGFTCPAFTAAAIAAVALAFAIIMIPESLKRNDRIERPAIIPAFLSPFKFYAGKENKGKRKLFIFLLFAFIFSDMTGVHRKTIEALYQLGMPFCWPPSKIGLFSTINAMAANAFGIIGLKAMQTCFKDATITFISIAVSAGAFVMEAIARTDILLYLVAVPSCLSNLPSPLIRSIMSTMTPTDKQGALSAGLLVVQTICSFLTGIADNAVYAATLPIYNGFIFFVFACYCMLCLLSLGAYMCLAKHSTASANGVNINTIETVK